jgi:hypothetical protein
MQQQQGEKNTNESEKGASDSDVLDVCVMKRARMCDKKRDEEGGREREKNFYCYMP